MNYQYILFDIDSTLIDFRKSFEKAAAKVLAMAGHPVNKEATDLYFQFNDDMWFGLNLHCIDREDIRKNYHRLYKDYIQKANEISKKEMGLKASVPELVECFKRELGACAVPNPNSIEMCQKLSATHSLCIATNGLLDVQPGKLSAFMPFLDKIFISEGVGYIKPEKEYFEYIVKELGCDKKDCIMVGDSLPNDINGANLAGITSVYYNPLHIVNNSGIVPDYEIDDFTQLLEIV